MKITVIACILSGLVYAYSYSDQRLTEMGKAVAVGIATLGITEQVVPLIVGAAYSACIGTDPLAHSDEIIPVTCGVRAV